MILLEFSCIFLSLVLLLFVILSFVRIWLLSSLSVPSIVIYCSHFYFHPVFKPKPNRYKPNRGFETKTETDTEPVVAVFDFKNRGYMVPVPVLP